MSIQTFIASQLCRIIPLQYLNRKTYIIKLVAYSVYDLICNVLDINRFFFAFLILFSPKQIKNVQMFMKGKFIICKCFNLSTF